MEAVHPSLCTRPQPKGAEPVQTMHDLLAQTASTRLLRGGPGASVPGSFPG